MRLFEESESSEFDCSGNARVWNLIKGTRKPLLNQFERNPKNGNFKLKNPQVTVKDLMKRIIRKNLQKKKKLGLTMDWVSKNGAVNPNQEKLGEEIICHKHASFIQKHGEKQFSLNAEIMEKFGDQPSNGEAKDLSNVYSEKIRDLEYKELLSRILESNRLKRNNNKFSLNVEDKEKVGEIYREVVSTGIKSQIISNANNVTSESNSLARIGRPLGLENGTEKEHNLEALTKNTIKDLLENINLIDTENFSDEHRRKEFLRRFENKSENLNSLKHLQENLFLIKEINPSVLTSVFLTRKPPFSWGTSRLWSKSTSR